MAEQTTAEKILENALAPKRARGDSGEAEMHSIADQILAKKLADDEAGTGARVGLGIRFTKLIPGNSD